MRVRAVFDGPDPMTLVAVSNHLFHLTCLVWVAYVLEDRARFAAPPSPGAGRRDLPANWAQDAVKGAQVERISSQAMLEIVLTLASAAPAVDGVTLAGTHVVDLFDSFQHAWWADEVPDAQVAARRTILRLLDRDRRDEIPDEMVRGAASALVHLASVEVEAL